jgi:hypothetical protein
MKTTPFPLALLFTVSALLFGGCSPPHLSGTASSTAQQPEETQKAPDEVRAALDAALAYVRE